jgi:hypothetical protein
MPTYSKVKLSASTSGRPIKVVATSSAGTTIHATLGSASTDEVYLYANNTDTVTRTLTIQWGGTSSPDDSIVVGIAAQAGIFLVIPGLILVDTGSAITVRAFASAANVINITGYVNRIV